MIDVINIINGYIISIFTYILSYILHCILLYTFISNITYIYILKYILYYKYFVEYIIYVHVNYTVYDMIMYFSITINIYIIILNTK